MKAYNLTHRKERAAYKKIYRAAHKEEYKASDKAYRTAHPKERKSLRLIYRYGLSQMAFDALFERQNHVCAICGKSKWNGRGPHVDHDHVTGKVRGIICENCNHALGNVKDSIPVLKRMIKYLRLNARKEVSENKHIRDGRQGAPLRIKEGSGGNGTITLAGQLSLPI